MLLVHDSVADQFVENLSNAISDLIAGMPWEPGVSLTPLPEPGKIGFLSALVDDAQAKGAVVVNPGGGGVNGTYFHPALLYPVTRDMRIYHEEQFGPVIPVVRFSEVDEVVAYVRDSGYGQQLSLFGRDPEQVGTLIDLAKGAA